MNSKSVQSCNTALGSSVAAKRMLLIENFISALEPFSDQTGGTSFVGSARSEAIRAWGSRRTSKLKVRVPLLFPGLSGSVWLRKLTRFVHDGSHRLSVG